MAICGIGSATPMKRSSLNTDTGLCPSGTLVDNCTTMATGVPAITSVRFVGCRIRSVGGSGVGPGGGATWANSEAHPMRNAASALMRKEMD